MFRLLATNVLRTFTFPLAGVSKLSSLHLCRNFSSLISQSGASFVTNLKPIQNMYVPSSAGLLKTLTCSQPLRQPTRSVTKFSLKKGKRKSVKAVLKRFKRLDWGIWIRTHCGRNKKIFKKSPALKRRLRQHVFTNSTQSWLLDSMVTSFWRRPKYYINDPYAPYHKREEYFATKSKTLKI